MLSYPALTALARQRQSDVARDVARCRHVRSLRVVVARALVAFGALTVCLGVALGEESERKPELFAV